MVCEVRLWGRCIGKVSSEGGGVARFMYDPDFLGAQIEPSPIMMPVRRESYSFPDLAESSFHGLPGLLADSVPDKFGNALIDGWLARQGRLPGSLSAVERLSYTGTRGMGALEYHPVLGDESAESERLQVDGLVDLASQVLASRRQGYGNIADIKSDLGSILKIGTSAGGARAKVLVAWNEETGELRSGQVEAPDGFGHWLLKLDGVSANGDKESDDEFGYGRIEYAYSLMAKAAGVVMSDSRLFDGGRLAHFITRRFDRDAQGGKLHMLTLGAIAHFDYNRAGANSYEQALAITETLTRDRSAVEQLFVRAVFNVLAMNCDDHVKNIAFLMDKAGRWSLAPAYDVIFAYNPAGAWTSSHQMSFNGKRTGICREDFMAVGAVAGISPQKVGHVVDEVRCAVARWEEFAKAAGVDEPRAERIGRVLFENLKEVFK